MSANRDQQIAEAIAEYLAAYDIGKPPDRRVFLAKYPELADSLEKLLDGHAWKQRTTATPLDLAAVLPPASPNTETIIQAPNADPDATLPPFGAGTTGGEALSPARYFGDYELLEEIARGGMGVVFKARQVSLNREVALKMILTGHLASATDIARFHAEAEAAANLDHPNILPIYEVGEHHGQHYFAMKFVAGGSLAGKVLELVNAPQAAAAVLVKVCQAVDFAHRRGILHRDLKPGNILLDADDTPYVTDFGLAKKVEGDSNLTQSGAIVGTPSYMAPEQARAEKTLTTSVDVYALGAIMYELLTGRPPFRGASVLDTILQVLEKDPPSPRAVNHTADRDLSLVALKCLEKDPSRRYESAAALAHDLEAFLAGRPVAARPVGSIHRAWRWRKRNPGLAAAIGAAILALVIGSALATEFGLRSRESAHAANYAAKRADEESSRAKLEARNARRMLGLIFSNEALKLTDGGHLSLGLLKMAQVLVVAPESPEAVALSRTQIGLYGRFTTPSCRLTRVFSSMSASRLLAFSHDGRLVLTASTNEAVQLWEVDTAKLVGQLQHPSAVNSAAFSSDGRRMVTLSQDNKARVWEVGGEKPLCPPLQHGGAILAAAFSPDGRRVVTGSNDQTAKIWDVNTGKAIFQPLQHNGAVLSVAFTPDGRRFVTGSYERFQLWDATTGAPAGPQYENSDGVRIVVFSRDGRRVLTANANDSARVWDVEAGKPICPPLQHEEQVLAAAFSPDGKQIVTGSWDKTARVWDVGSGKPITPPLRHDDSVLSVAFSPDGRRVLTGSKDGTARVWDVESGKPLSPFLQHAEWVMATAFTSDGRQLRIASNDGNVRVWEFDTIKTLDFPIANERGRFIFSPDARRVLTIGIDSARIWDIESGKPITPPLKYNSLAHAAAFTTDGQRVLIANEDEPVRVWDTDSGKLLSSTIKPSGTILAAAFSPDGQRIITGCDDNLAQVWDAGAGKQISPAIRHGSWIAAVAFSPDGRRVLTGSDDNTAGIFDAESGAPLTARLRHTARVAAVVFSPDGRRVLTGSEDKTARVWDAESGKPITPPLQHTAQVNAVAFSGDGRRVLTGCDDYSARVWDAETGKPLSPPLPHDDAVTAVAFGPDDQRALAASLGETIRVWDVAFDDRPVEDIVGMSQLLSAHRVDDTGAIVPLTAEQQARLWMVLRLKYPDEFAVAPQSVRRWREEEIQDCMVAGNIRAAEFHYLALIAELATGKAK